MEAKTLTRFHPPGEKSSSTTGSPSRTMGSTRGDSGKVAESKPDRQKKKGGGPKTLDFGEISLDASSPSKFLDKAFPLTLPSEVPLLSVHRSCTCVEFSLELPSGRLLPLRKPFLPRSLGEPPEKTFHLRLRKPSKTKTVQGEVSLIFQNGDVRRVLYRCLFFSDFGFYPKTWEFKAEEARPKCTLTVNSGKPFQILSLVQGVPGLDAKFHPKNSKKTIWIAELSYVGKTPMPDFGEVVLGISGGRRLRVPWKRLPAPDLRLMPEPFFFFPKVPLLGKRKKTVWFEGWKRGDKVLELDTKGLSSNKVRFQVQRVKDALLKQKRGPTYVVSLQNMGLGAGDSYQGSLVFRLLREGGRTDAISLDLLVMGKN